MIWIMISMITSLGLSQNQNITSMACTDCHNKDSWLPLSDNPKFNHNTTLFQLMGQHRFADCVQCHIGETQKEKHQFNFNSYECSDCHYDIHQNTNGPECEKCHTTATWVSTQTFNHALTLFPLSGSHQSLLCQDCHQTDSQNWTSWIPTDCEGCHQSQINEKVLAGNHTENSECILCHNTWSWTPTDMSHHDALFPIYSGKHKNEWSSCTAECHIMADDFTNFSCGLNGVCHDHSQSEMDEEHDDEAGYIYESTACYQCHPNGSEDD